MIVISHRGNLTGPSSKENTLEAWKEFCELKITKNVVTYCELDLWYHNGTYWLGHDQPVQGIDSGLLWDMAIVWHCKNFAACKHLSWQSEGHFFFHEDDPYTITSKGWVWAAPGQQVNESTVIVCKDLESTIKTVREGKAMGVCTDYFLQALEEVE